MLVQLGVWCEVLWALRWFQSRALVRAEKKCEKVWENCVFDLWFLIFWLYLYRFYFYYRLDFCGAIWKYFVSVMLDLFYYLLTTKRYCLYHNDTEKVNGMAHFVVHLLAIISIWFSCWVYSIKYNKVLVTSVNPLLCGRAVDKFLIKNLNWNWIGKKRCASLTLEVGF